MDIAELKNPVIKNSRNAKYEEIITSKHTYFPSVAIKTKLICQRITLSDWVRCIKWIYYQYSESSYIYDTSSLEQSFDS